MKHLLIFLLITLSFLRAVDAQLNMSLQSHLEYPSRLSDVWGYTAPDGTEYALVGNFNGVSIVSLADANNAVEVAFVEGQGSAWRDIKTWGNYAYVVADQPTSDEGLTVIDLSNLPQSVSSFQWQPDLAGLGQLEKCHNLFIDDHGYAYLAGCNINNGGVLFIDVFSVPGQPQFIAAGVDIRSHDVYVRNDKMYSSEVSLGRLAIYDVSNKNATVLEGVQETPFEYTHNTWLSDDGQVIFTTDEQANAPVAAYDISDPEDIVELDQFRPLASINTRATPHNVQVWDDFLIISYYTLGGIIVDASRPDNLIEVGNFDTFIEPENSQRGVWGAFPYFASGTVLLTDIQNGLFVLQPDYKRACHLEGIVTDAVTGGALNGVEVSIITEEINLEKSSLDGSYKTGIAEGGSFTVKWFKPGYEIYSQVVNFENGLLRNIDVVLVPLPKYDRLGKVIDRETGTPIDNAEIVIENDYHSFTANTNEQGKFVVEQVYAGPFQVYVGAWGYQQMVVRDFNNDATSSAFYFELDRGYEDDFFADLGWSTKAAESTTAGFWELGMPNGTFYGFKAANPGSDAADDLGKGCYMTGNTYASLFSFGLEGGWVTLISPPMALADNFFRPVLEYQMWFAKHPSQNTVSDKIVVSVSNGTEEVIVETIENSQETWREKSEIVLSDYIPVTNEMRVLYHVEQPENPGVVVEAGIDAFAISGELKDRNLAGDPIRVQIGPSPFNSIINLQYQLLKWQGVGSIYIYNSLGQIMKAYTLEALEGSMTFGEGWPAGIYFVVIDVPGEGSLTKKIIKQ